MTAVDMVCATMTWGNADASMDMLVSLTLSGTSGGSLGPKGGHAPRTPEKCSIIQIIHISLTVHGF
jgi:hypothetical protein